MTTHDAKTTTNHEEIRRWAEARGGKPATVHTTVDVGDKVGVLRIAFTDDGTLDPIGWDVLFDKFDDADLAFLYQENTEEGDTSRFFKFVERER
ncbi:MAG: hypothetical protein ACREP0_00010 [Rhodanobacteraceae bacterium]